MATCYAKCYTEVMDIRGMMKGYTFVILTAFVVGIVVGQLSTREIGIGIVAFLLGLFVGYLCKLEITNLWTKRHGKKKN